MQRADELSENCPEFVEPTSPWPVGVSRFRLQINLTKPSGRIADPWRSHQSLSTEMESRSKWLRVSRPYAAGRDVSDIAEDVSLEIWNLGY